jgi:hypothetical protein
VDPQSRTAKIRVALAYADGGLRLGVQAAKDEAGKFIQRTVRLGSLVGETYAVVSGLRAGDAVVTERSVLLRAESVRNSPSG